MDEKPKEFGFGPGVKVRFVGFSPCGAKVYSTNVMEIIAQQIAEQDQKKSKN